jgi:hypothetical protein
MNLRSTRRLVIVVALFAVTAVTGCGGASLADDAVRGSVRTADDVPVSGISGADPPTGGVVGDVSHAEVESTEARGVLRKMLESDDRTWICLGLELVEAASDGELTMAEYGEILIDHGFSYVPAYRVQQAFDATVQLLDGDFSQLQDLACA